MTAAFLQSEVQYPYQLYQAMLADCPVYRDEEAGLWAIYSYQHCSALLNNDRAEVPVVNTDGLNDCAHAITAQLARLSNGAPHDIARQVGMRLMERMRTVAVADLCAELLQPAAGTHEIDWVAAIGKRLPLQLVLKSFGFKDADAHFISHNMDTLLKIMLPAKTAEQVSLLNKVSAQIYALTENHLLATGLFNKEAAVLSANYKISVDAVLAYAITNLIGLCIQCYDAGRGLLSNALLQALQHPARQAGLVANEDYLRRLVVETIRFDPPVHNTRRVAADDLVAGDVQIKKGERLLLVLAAANRDPQQFGKPMVFDTERPNNHENITFGPGGHACVAKHFSINLTVKCLGYLFGRYPRVRLATQNIAYEALVNVRLVREMVIALL